MNTGCKTIGDLRKMVAEYSDDEPALYSVITAGEVFYTLEWPSEHAVWQATHEFVRWNIHELSKELMDNPMLACKNPAKGIEDDIKGEFSLMLSDPIPKLKKYCGFKSVKDAVDVIGDDWQNWFVNHFEIQMHGRGAHLVMPYSSEIVTWKELKKHNKKNWDKIMHSIIECIFLTQYGAVQCQNGCLEICVCNMQFKTDNLAKKGPCLCPEPECICGKYCGHSGHWSEK